MAELQYPDYPHYPRPWSHAAKIECLQLELASRGVKKNAAAPPFFRLLWKLGLEVPPPLFLSFAQNASFLGGLFAVGWGLWMWAWLYFCMKPVKPIPLFLMSFFAGLIFGLAMAGWVKWQNRKLKLPLWQNYPAEPADIFSQPL